MDRQREPFVSNARPPSKTLSGVAPCSLANNPLAQSALSEGVIPGVGRRTSDSASDREHREKHERRVHCGCARRRDPRTQNPSAYLEGVPTGTAWNREPDKFASRPWIGLEPSAPLTLSWRSGAPLKRDGPREAGHIELRSRRLQAQWCEEPCQARRRAHR